MAFNAQVAQTAVRNGRHPAEQRLARWMPMAHDRVEGDEFPMTHEFLATGMTVHVEACPWVALWGGERVSRFAPDGWRLVHVEGPTGRVTSCAFGGADMRTLFINSASGAGSAGARQAGGVFAAWTTVAGMPPGRMRWGEAPGGSR